MTANPLGTTPWAQRHLDADNAARAILPRTEQQDAEADAYISWDGLSRAPTRAMPAHIHDLGGPLPVDEDETDEEKEF